AGQLDKTLDRQKAVGKNTESLVINYFKNKQETKKVVSFAQDEVNKGYDICVTEANRERHIEIKTAQKYSDNKLSFYISYKELQVGAQDSNWEILAVVNESHNNISFHKINQQLAQQVLKKINQLLQGDGFAIHPQTIRVVVSLEQD
ncbi:MAG: DUF3883 domain-containing protein, partial [Candidatus Pacebacteria bacterium]|nr:DUF3883 domain-containing protein [Candidatus Paceibacterota bacterium]